MLKFLPKARALASRLPGFTMIELLIVITILGILAVAVLSAINPIEQINRGRDTSLRSDAEQLISAIDRYNAFNQFYPWQVGEADIANRGLALTRFTTTDPENSDSSCTVASLLSSGTAGCTGSQELKESFINRVTPASARGLFVFNNGDNGDSTYVCFVPQSGAFKTEASKRCTDGLPADLSPIGDIVCDVDRGGSAMAALADDGAAICLP